MPRISAKSILQLVFGLSRKAGALRGGSYELSSRERGSVAVVVDVVPASAPMASTGTGSEGLEIRIDWIVAAGS